MCVMCIDFISNALEWMIRIQCVCVIDMCDCVCNDLIIYLFGFCYFSPFILYFKSMKKCPPGTFTIRPTSRSLMRRLISVIAWSRNKSFQQSLFMLTSMKFSMFAGRKKAWKFSEIVHLSTETVNPPKTIAFRLLESIENGTDRFVKLWFPRLWPYC